MNIEAGAKAPSFTLFDSDKNKVSLADFAGHNVVLLFFPQAFTGVCTQELCSVRDSMAHYESLSAKVLGISVDSIFTLARFKQDQGYNFPLLSDFNKEVCEAYGAKYDTFVFDMKGVARRAAFVVDKDGIVRYAQVLESAGDLPDFDAIQSTLAGLA